MFASLGAVVSIGFLSVSVGEKSLLKSIDNKISANTLEDIVDAKNESESLEKEEFLSVQTELILLNQKTETVAVYGSIYYIYNQMPVERNNSFDRHFYF